MRCRRLALAILVVLATGAGIAPAQELPLLAICRIGSEPRFPGAAARLLFSPDGAVLFAMDNHQVRLFDSKTGRTIRTLEHRTRRIPAEKEEPARVVVDMVLNKKGDVLATADDVGAIRLWDVAKGTQRRFAKMHPGAVTVCFSEDESEIFSGGMDGMVRAWKAADAAVERLAWKADGKATVLALAARKGLVLGVTAEGLLLGWDPKTGTEKRRVELGSILTGFPNDPALDKVSKGGVSNSRNPGRRNVVFSPDGRWLLQHQGLRLWDTDRGEIAADLPPPEMHVAMQFSGDGKWIAVGQKLDTGTAIRIYSTEDSKEVASIKGMGLTAVAIHPDGETIAYRTLTGVHVWNRRKGAFEGEAPVGAFRDWDYSAKANAFAIGHDLQIAIYDGTTGRRSGVIPVDKSLGFVRFTANGKALIVGLSGFACVKYEKKGERWEAVRIDKTPHVFHAFVGPARIVPCARDGNTACDVETGQYVSPMPSRDKFDQARITADGRYMLVAAEVMIKRKPGENPNFGPSYERQEQLLEIPSFKVAARFKADVRGQGHGITADGRVAYYDNNPIKVVEISTGADRGTIKPQANLHSYIFAPDGRTIVGSTIDGDLVVVSAATGKELHRISKPLGSELGGLAARITPEGRIATVSSSSAAMVWAPELWKGRAPSRKLKLDAEDLDLFYEALGSASGANLSNAISSMIDGDAATVSYLKRKLQPDTEKSELRAVLKAVRSIEVLERIGSDEAARVIRGLAGGHAEGTVTRQAVAALERLTVTRPSASD